MEDLKEESLPDCEAEEVSEDQYYVYATYVNKKLRYIGMGCGDRLFHTVSGISQVLLLNRDFFAGKHMLTKVHEKGLTRAEALLLEGDYIHYHHNHGDELYNKKVLNNFVMYEEPLPKGSYQSYSSIYAQRDLGIDIDVTGMKSKEWCNDLIGLCHTQKYRPIKEKK
jgi:hypothetical protein